MLTVKKKNITLLLIAILSLSICFSQHFKPHETKMLNSFGLVLKPDTQINKNHLIDFKTILKKERKRKSNKTAGIILSSVGVFSTSLGILVLSRPAGDGMGKGIQESIGGLLVGAGLVSGGISIPLFNSASKKRKQRDKLIEKYTVKN